MNATHPKETLFAPAGKTPPRGFLRNRLQSFGLTLIVMGASFFLYYLGLFGTVDGPLAPARMGSALSSMGVGQRHVIGLPVSLLSAAVSWNWLYNLGRLLAGQRMTCNHTDKASGEVCGAVTRRLRHVSRRSGHTVVEYRCPHGHRRPEAHFHPVRKGTVSHTIWVGCAVFTLIAFFCA